MEQWRAVVGFEGLYEVSDQGHVRSLDRRVRSRGGTRMLRGRVLKPQRHSVGYRQVGMRGRIFLVHAIVLAAFVGPCPAGREVDHGDGDKTNNRLGNLRYATKKENAEDRRRHGTSGRGEANAGAKLTAVAVAAIRASTAGRRELAVAHGVTANHITRLRAGGRW